MKNTSAKDDFFPAKFANSALHAIVQPIAQRKDIREIGPIRVLSEIASQTFGPTASIPPWEISITHDDGYASRQLLAIAGLIELSLMTEYIDGFNDEDMQGLKEIFYEFRATWDRYDQTGLKDLSFPLFQSLINRFSRNDAGRVSITDGGAVAFESYLNLTAFVWADRSFHEFLAETFVFYGSNRQASEGDLRFLLSPRHFAAALTTQHIGHVKTANVAGAFKALRYYHWFAQILHQLPNTPDLKEAFLRHAEWCHNARHVMARLDFWAERMSEWDQRGVDIGEKKSWNRYRDEVFLPLMTQFEALQQTVQMIPPEQPPQPAEIAPLKMFDLEEKVRDIMAEGRYGAALQLTRAAAESKYTALIGMAVSSNDWLSTVAELISCCRTLAETGDLDSAAAYLAPLLDTIRSRSLPFPIKGRMPDNCLSKEQLDQAVDIVKQSTTAGQVRLHEEVASDDPKIHHSPSIKRAENVPGSAISPEREDRVQAKRQGEGHET